ncbi:unnamed protein product [Haemonchus placei]|uniref:Nucleolar protein 14 n=1 Tax=Haemonchus placei TaxID=6290 RepID=A0A3P7UYQ9_HAEPC|nr:unnamed protein product [Haemonchus placei]
MKFNRLKHDVLGKKKGTVDVGHPGLSRKRAYEQRKKTLGVEYDRIGKVNKIVDRRIGEKNKNITSEEKASLRFAAERAKHLKKGSKFNLTDVNEEEDEELLTHGGRALTDIQKYDKTIVSDDDDDGNIGADVVKVAHFGGGELDNSTKPDVKLSRKDVIADLIAKTRQVREEKHIAKDELETITEDLDAKYHRLLGKVKTVFRPVGATKAEKSEKDDYDKLAISLKIDADSRATPAERTKTVDELAAEERCYLEEMESLRKARMNEEVLCSILHSFPLTHCDLDVPFLFEMPKKYDAFVELLSKYPAEKIDIVLQRLIKCYHPSLAEGNKKLLSKLFLYLLRYYDDLSNSPLSDDSVKVLGFLTKFDVEFGVRCVRALIRQKWKKRMNKPKSPTEFSLISLLRLIASLFPVSDRWHPVCTPAMALAAVSLAKCQIRDLTILTRQILLATVLSDYVEESKRYIPEAIAFCQGALLVAVENEESEHIPSVAFPISMPHRRMLLISKVSWFSILCVDDSDLNKCAVLRALTALIQKYRILYFWSSTCLTKLRSRAHFRPFVDLLKRLPTGRMPSLLAEEVEALTRSMEAECMLRSRLTQMSRTVTEKSMLKMLEPRFEDNFDPERPRMGARAEKEKLRHLVKNETRGAIKELRKDAAFLNRKQLKETAAKDKDRKEKTKRLMGGLQSQQGEWNKELWESGKKPKK